MRDSVLLAFFASEFKAAALDDAGWSLLFAEARSVGLHHRLTARLRSDGLAESLPEALRRHLQASEIETAAFQRDVLREIEAIKLALGDLDVPRILLKGAAYVFCQLPAAQGRIFSDIDLLVPKAALPNAESQLMCHGWLAGALTDYDHRYYREWSHEIPPLTHVRRGTTIDLHHSLVMPTCRLKVDSQLMISEAIALENGWWRLNDLDMILHSVAHLLLNSEFNNGLRDISDIDLLCRNFANDSPDFFSRLEARAQLVGMGDFLYLAAALCHAYFRTPLPETWLTKSSMLLFGLFRASCGVRHPETRPQLQGLADFTLMVRELYYRFPLTILVRHLAHKLLSSNNSPENAAN